MEAVKYAADIVIDSACYKERTGTFNVWVLLITAIYHITLIAVGC
jgi:hypothetical protein